MLFSDKNLFLRTDAESENGTGSDPQIGVESEVLDDRL